MNVQRASNIMKKMSRKKEGLKREDMSHLSLSAQLSITSDLYMSVTGKRFLDYSPILGAICR